MTVKSVLMCPQGLRPRARAPTCYATGFRLYEITCGVRKAEDVTTILFSVGQRINIPPLKYKKNIIVQANLTFH